MSEQAFIDAALSRELVQPEQLHAALAVRTRWTSVAGRLCAAGVDRERLLALLSEVTGLAVAPNARLLSPEPVSLSLALTTALRRIGAVPLGYDAGGLLVAVISSAAHEELARLDLPRHHVVVALEQDVMLAAGVLEDPAETTAALGDDVSAETLEGGVRGDLASMSVAAITKLLAPHEKDACVLLELADGTRGKLGFLAGRLVFAAHGEQRGEDAVQRLERARRGRFRVLYGERPEEANIAGFLMETLTEPLPPRAPLPVELPELAELETFLETQPAAPLEANRLLDDDERAPTQHERRERAPAKKDAGDHAYVATEIAGYRLGALIGRGAGGLVHRATRISDGEEVALKLISPDRSTSAHFMQRAKRETTVQASLRHRNVVAVYAFGQEGELWYLASELVAGGPLSKKLREAGPLPSGLVALLVRDILAGIEHAHHNHVIHRDIKPGNVLLTTEGRAKLADFGLARSLYDPFRTKPGVVMGTPQYMSPEQVSGSEDTDYRTDFFSIASIAYEMLTGTSPFKDASPARSMLAVARGERPALVDSEPAVLPLLESAIEHLGQRRPEDRPEKAALILDRLDPLAYAVDRLFPDAGARFVAAPRETARALRQGEAKLELERALRLLSSGQRHVPQAAFAAWRASALDPELQGARDLRDRLALDNGYRFEPSTDPSALVLEEKLVEQPNDSDLLRRLGDLYREERNVPLLTARLRRLCRVCPDDDDTQAALSQMLGDPMGPFKRR